MRRLLLAVLVCACGRVGFDDRTAGDGGGSAASLTLSYPTAQVSAVINITPISLSPTVSKPARFTVTPDLPPGVTLDATTGVIAGTPTASARQTYTIMAAAGGETATAPLDLLALPGYVVDSTGDQPDANPPDGVCAIAGGGCTLRAAVQTVNAQTTQQLVLLGIATYSLGSALDPITNDVVIAGQGITASTIRAATVHPAYPALTLASAHTLALRDLAIDDFGGSDGGALAVTAGSLDVDRCDFDNNASPTSGGVLFINGGAKATIARSTFTRNASLGGNGGGWGGVIDGEGTGTDIVVTRSLATANTTAWGSFSHITTGTTLRLENSTLYGNTSTTAGTLATPGGIYTLVNDTIVGNTNTGGDSAGIYLYSAPCHYTVTNTIVFDNLNMPGGAEQDCHIRDVTTTITSDGGNILGDAGNNCTQYFNDPTDRLSTNPALSAATPSQNGGETLTLLLGPGSPALDTGVASACPSVDQRDLPRPVGPGCDIGSVEMQ